MTECNKCHRPGLAIGDMVKDVGRPSKYRALCKQCKQQEKSRIAIPAVKREVLLPLSAEMSPRQKRNFGGARAYTGPRERQPGEALPWSIDKMAGTYVPEPQHQRNDGLKHIKSRGV